MPITAEKKQVLVDILKDVSGVELVRIAGAVYDSFVAADLPWEKMFTIANHMFAKVPWSRLPKGLGNVQVNLIRAVDEKLLRMIPDLLDVYVDEPQAAEEPAPATNAAPIIVEPLPGDGQSTITFQSSTPPITPTTRSEIDELDEEASMHGMDTESAPEGAEVPVEQIRVESADDDTAAEDDPTSEDDEDEPAPDVQVATSPDSNGHNKDVVPATPDAPPDAPATTP